MRFELTAEQEALRDTARAFAAEALAPHAAEWDEEGHFPVETLREAAALGFAGLYVREDVGGSGLSRLDAALLFEELSAACTSTAAFLSIHNMVVVDDRPLRRRGAARALAARPVRDASCWRATA